MYKVTRKIRRKERDEDGKRVKSGQIKREKRSREKEEKEESGQRIEDGERESSRQK